MWADFANFAVGFAIGFAAVVAFADKAFAAARRAVQRRRDAKQQRPLR